MFTVYYLDNAATTRRKPFLVYMNMLRYALASGGNAGRGNNKLSLKGINEIISAQDTAAELFGIDEPSNIVFTQNATYALNLAILGTLKEKDHIVVTAMDHNSVLRPAARWGRYSVAGADRNGYVSPLEIRRCIKENTAMVVSTHISNVCGTVEPIAETARAAHNSGAVFLLDASQSAGSVEIDVNKTGIDMLACPGHKGLYGPMGSGLLYIKEPERVGAVITGGTGSESESLFQPQSMPDKFHCGTVNLPAIAGLKEGMRFVIKEGAVNIGRYENELNRLFREELSNINNITVYGRGESSLTAFNINGLDSNECAALLGDGIIVRAGFHCAPLAHKALGTERSGAVRVSFGYFNTKKDIKRAVDAIYSVSKNFKRKLV